MESRDRNPQAAQMADESMVRNLAAQAEAIWPQEVDLVRAYGLSDDIRILDVGCGTGEISVRLAELFPRAHVLGIDIIDPHLELARRRSAHLGERVRFEHGDAFALPLPDGSFDLTVCRHMLQAVPRAELVLAELVRVTRPGGRLHLISEDYGMIHLHPTRLDTDTFWHAAPTSFGKAVGVDNHIGRATFTHLHALPVCDIGVTYLPVDTIRVPRETFARIWEAWRDGYTDVLAEHTRFTRDEVLAHWEDMLRCIRDPRGYALWQVPVWTAVVGGVSVLRA